MAEKDGDMRTNREKSIDSNPKVIELFGGAGLFGGAFAKEGFTISQAVEIDPVACATYKANLGDHVDNKDVRSLTPSGKSEVLVAGPPCQGFSTMGKRDKSDKRNYLSMEVLRWAAATSSKVVVIENVPPFLTSEIWLQVAKEFDRLEYDIRTYVLNAYDFGVPQIRNRAFIIASKIGFPNIRAINRKKIGTVREAWSDLPLRPDGKNLHYAPKPSELALRRMQIVPEGGNKNDIMRMAPNLAPPSWAFVRNELGDVWGRMRWDKPSNTLRTCFQNPSKGRYIHPEEDRVISLREAARLHSIDDSWKFCGSPTQIARQIGNSVPPFVGRAIARAVRSLFS
jgi:DNA (cytosine-5)-methyltransferase 1